MSDMPGTHRHVRERWTWQQALLASVCALIGFAVAVFAFIDIYSTVTHLVAPSFGWRDWTVPLCAEGLFTGIYLGWLLLELRDDPPRVLRFALTVLLSAMVLGSLSLNLLASTGAADSVAHAVVVVGFFSYLVFAKVMVRRLTADPAERAMAAAVASARLYAIDVLRARQGIWWRLRVPSLLRRNVLSGRLADEVRDVITERVSEGRTAGWERAVREWVLGPDGLNLDAQAEADSGRTRKAISEAASVPALEAPPEAAPETPPAPAPATSRKAPPDYSRKLARGKGRNMTPEQLAPYAEHRIKATGKTSKNDLRSWLGVGDAKLADVLALIEPGPNVIRMAVKA